jgi:hypothetical protein
MSKATIYLIVGEEKATILTINKTSILELMNFILDGHVMVNCLCSGVKLEVFLRGDQNSKRVV